MFVCLNNISTARLSMYVEHAHLLIDSLGRQVKHICTLN